MLYDRYDFMLVVYNFTERLKKWFFSNLANMITTARLILSAWLIFLAIYDSSRLALMLTLVTLCGVSDTLDGWIARRYKIISEIGGFLDRIADKIFICPTIVILVWRYWPENHIADLLKLLTGGLVASVILLETLLVFFGIFGLLKRLDVSSNLWGRKKMVLQSAVVFLWFVALNIDKYFGIKLLLEFILLIDILLIAAVGLAVKSIEGYWQRYQFKI